MGNLRFNFSLLNALALLVVLCSLTSVTSSSALEFQLIEPDEGPNILAVTGEFTPEYDYSGARRQIVGGRVGFVTFDSPGGNIVSAIEFGRLIRQFELDTVQLRSYECSSACALAFLGGVNRYADAGAIGVHRSSFAEESGLDSSVAVSVIQELTADIIGYILEMGADPSLLKLALKYDSSDMRYLSRSEMVEFGVITESEPEEADPPLLASVPDGTSEAASEKLLLGVVRHPAGGVYLKRSPDVGSESLKYLMNRADIEVLEIAGSWYRVRSEDQTGWLERSWVKVEGTYGTYSERRFIQVKSYRNYASAEAYAKASNPPLWVFSTITDWYAVTLPATFEREEALRILDGLKKRTEIPSDSFVHYGNTFLERLCC